MSQEKFLQQLRDHSISLARKDYTKGMSKHQLDVFNSFCDMKFGCQTENVRRFAIAFMGNEFPPSNVIFIPGTIVVPLDNDNGHDYEDGEPVFILYSDYGIGSNRVRIGNHLPKSAGSIRAATEKEIEKFYNGLRSVEAFISNVRNFTQFEFKEWIHR